MTGENERRVVVITGAAGGMGSAIARRFARDGAHVVLSDMHSGGVEALAGELGGRFVLADVTREAEVAALVQAALDAHGRIDVMVNNAGVIGATGSIIETEAENWSRTLAILLDSVFYGMKHAGKAMKAAGRGGAILSTASIGGIECLAPHAYTAAKTAVIGLTRSVAVELAPHRIRVNAVAPGYIPTPMTIQALGGEDEMRATVAGRNPMPTVVETDEIAGAFAYLASDDARNLTGQVISVDAGVLAARLPASFYEVPAGFLGSSTLKVN